MFQLRLALYDTKSIFADSYKVSSCWEKSYQSFMKRIIVGDEAWIYIYDSEIDDKSSEYRAIGEPRPQKNRDKVAQNSRWW